MTPIRVLVADDEETVVDVLRALIGSDPSLRFVGAAHNAEDAIELTVRERPDVVLLDVRMPGGGGLRATREITKRCAPTKVVALSAHEDSDTVIGMISAGASAYVPKGDSTDKILRTIHRTIDADYVMAEQSRSSTLVSPMLPRRTQQSTAVAKAILEGDDHGGVRTDRRARHGTDRRPRCPPTRRDPPPAFVRHMAGGCGGRRAPARRGDGRFPSKPLCAPDGPRRPLPRVRGDTLDRDGGSVPPSHPQADRLPYRPGFLVARDDRPSGGRSRRSRREP